MHVFFLSVAHRVYTISSFDSVGEGLRDFTSSEEGIVRRTRDILEVVSLANVYA